MIAVVSGVILGLAALAGSRRFKPRAAAVKSAVFAGH
jgi:hypothetical protein